MNVPADRTNEADAIPTDVHKFALIVGVNNSSVSSHLASLKYAEDDAIEVYQTLRQDDCGFTFLDPVLTGSKAGTAEVRSAVIRLVDEKTNQDFLLFYFVGHAQPVKTKQGYSDIYFVTHNFNPKEVKKDTNAHLSLRWLRDILYQPDGAGSVLIILDCCYAGNMIEIRSDPGLIHIDVDVRKIVEECLDGPVIKYQNGRLRVILTATGYNTPAQERVMTRLILSALQGKTQQAIDDKGDVNIHSLYTYLQDQMPQVQLPNLSGEFARKCILAHYPEKSSDHLQQLQRAEEDDRWNKVSKLINRISEVSDTITDPNYFRKLAEVNLRYHIQQFDRVIEENASIVDLNQEMIIGFLKTDLVQRQDDFIRGASYRDQLRQFGLLQKSYPTYGALLSFGLYPTKWLAGAFTRCTLWSGNDRHHGWLEAQDYQRDLVTQFELSRDFLRKNLRLSRVIGRDARSQELEIPLVALGEALANALVHREYVNQTSPVYVDIFNDRVEISSPGVPPEPMTIEILEEEHKSHPRNPQIARIFYLYGYVEKIGSGIQRMQQTMKDTGLPSVQFELGKDKTFKAIFSRPQQASEAMLSAVPSNEVSVNQSKAAPIWDIPYRRNLFFTGRDELLRQIHDNLTVTKTAALTQAQAISGLGGIGKTQLAIEFAYRYQQDYQAVFWLRADTHEALISGFVTIARLLNLPEKDAQDQMTTVTAIQHWLRTHTNWLLILDDADDLLMVREFIPPAFGGHLLLTTRAQATGGIAQHFEVSSLSPEQGALFLLRRTHLIAPEASLEQAPPADVVLAQEITQELGGLPLALDQVGAYIEAVNCSLSDYRHLYQERRIDFLKQRGRLVQDHPEAVATTWSLSFQKIEQANPAAADLLRFFAFLSPDAIPEEIIIEGASHLGKVLSSAAVDQFALNETIGVLLRYSLIRRNSTTKVLYVHRLIQVVLKDNMNFETQLLWAERTVKVIEEIFPDIINVTTWPQCERYLSQALICVDLISQYSISLPRAANLLNRIGQYLNDHALYGQAERLYQLALAIYEKVLGPEHPSVAASLNNLAVPYTKQGKYEQAEQLYQRALAIYEKVLGPEHPSVAASLNNLAMLYTKQDKYEQAEQLYQRALAIYEKVLGPERPDMAQSLNNLAVLYTNQDKYEQAEQLYQQALAIYEKVLGSEHPSVAASLHNLAELYTKQGKYEQAEQLYQQALAIYEKVLGPEHPDTANSLHNLAVLYTDEDKYEQAEPLYMRALTIYEKVLGSEHPVMAQSLNNLAELYTKQGKYEQAEQLYQQALTIYEKMLGHEHSSVAISLNNLAGLYANQGKYEQAEPLYMRALTIWEHQLGPLHPDTAQSLNNLAGLYANQGKYEQAEPLYQRALTIREQQLGPMNPDTLSTQESYTKLLQKVKRGQAPSIREQLMATNTMDPLTLVLTALTVGAASSTRAIENDAVRDSYHGLKTLLKNAFAGKMSAEVALGEYERNPQIWEAPLKHIFMQERIDQEKDIIEAAWKVITLMNAQETKGGKYNVQIPGIVQGFAQGDLQQVTMLFGDESNEK